MIETNEDTPEEQTFQDDVPESAPIVYDGTSGEKEDDSDESEASKSLSSNMVITTRRDINEDNRVSKVEFEDQDGHKCTATIREDDPAYYDYESDLFGDDEAVQSGVPMSLADVILAAYVHLGLIPPHNFASIPCRNKH